MKTLFFVLNIFFILGLNGQQSPGVQAEVVSVSPDPFKQKDVQYSVTIRLTNKMADSLKKRDIIHLSSFFNNKTYVIGPYQLKDTVLPDSSTTISINCTYEKGILNQYPVAMYVDASAFSPRQCINCIYINEGSEYKASMDVTHHFPKYEEEEAPMDRLELEYWPSMSQLSVKFNSPYQGSTLWKLTDHAGRVILRGRAELVVGDNTFTIDLTGAAGGRYTLSIGTGADEYDDTFTIIGR